MNVEQFRGKKVLIFGLGAYPKGSGVSAALFLAKAGAEIRVTDLKSADDLADNMKQLEGFEIDYVLGEHRMEDVEWADLIVQNPGVRSDSEFLRAARVAEKRIENDISLFLHAYNGPMIGVTGTRGKSTTAAMIWNCVRQSQISARLAGNIQVSPLSFIDELGEKDPIILELSSWQLHSFVDFQFRFPVAVLTNIMEDHANMYPDEAAYIEDKKQIFLYQKPEDVLVMNGEDLKLQVVTGKAASQKRLFSLSEKKDAYLDGSLLKLATGNDVYTICSVDHLKVKGEHNVANALAAALAADAFGVSHEDITKGLLSFEGLPHRLQNIGTVKGVTVISDSTSTTPDALTAAVGAYPGAVIIAGGMDKELSYDQLKDVAGEIKKLVLIPGSGSKKIKETLGERVEVIEVKTLDEALRTGLGLTEEGGVLVFSPAAASFNMFKNEFDRANQFERLVTQQEGYAEKT